MYGKDFFSSFNLLCCGRGLNRRRSTVGKWAGRFATTSYKCKQLTLEFYKRRGFIQTWESEEEPAIFKMFIYE